MKKTVEKQSGGEKKKKGNLEDHVGQNGEKAKS